MLAKWHEHQLCEYSEADKLHVLHAAAMGHRRALIHAIDIHVIVLYSFFRYYCCRGFGWYLFFGVVAMTGTTVLAVCRQRWLSNPLVLPYHAPCPYSTYR